MDHGQVRGYGNKGAGVEAVHWAPNVCSVSRLVPDFVDQVWRVIAKNDQNTPLGRERMSYGWRSFYLSYVDTTAHTAHLRPYRSFVHILF